MTCGHNQTVARHSINTVHIEKGVQIYVKRTEMCGTRNCYIRPENIANVTQ